MSKSIEAQLPKEVSKSTYSVRGETYEVLRYSAEKGPTLQQTIAIAEKAKGEGREMLTYAQSREIADVDETSGAFKSAGVLKPGEWAYVRSQSLEKRGRAACLYWGGGLGAYDYVRADDAAPVVLLKVKKNGSEAAAPKAGVLETVESRFNELQSALTTGQKREQELRKESADKLSAAETQKADNTKIAGELEELRKFVEDKKVLEERAKKLIRNE